MVSRSTGFQGQLPSGSASLVSAAHRGPQRFVQAGFQTGEGEGAGPGLPGDDVCQRCAGNTREFFDCSQRSIAYDQLQLFDEQSVASRIGSVEVSCGQFRHRSAGRGRVLRGIDEG